MTKKSSIVELSLSLLGDIHNRLGDRSLTDIVALLEKESIDIVDWLMLAKDEPESKNYSYDNVEINVFQWSGIWLAIDKNPSKFIDFINKEQNQSKIAHKVLTLNPSSILDIKNPEIMSIFMGKPVRGTPADLKLDNEKTEKILSQAFDSLSKDACIRWMNANNLDKKSQIMGHNIIKLLQDNTHIKDYGPFMLTVEDFASKTKGMAKNKNAALWVTKSMVPDGDLKVKKMAHMLANELRTAENPYLLTLVKDLLKKFPEKEIWDYRFDTSESGSTNKPKSIIECLTELELLRFKKTTNGDCLIAPKKRLKSINGRTASNSLRVIGMLSDNLKLNPEHLKTLFINIIQKADDLLANNDLNGWVTENNLDFIKKNVFPQITDSNEIRDAVIKINSYDIKWGSGNSRHLMFADALNVYVQKTDMIEKILKRMYQEKCGFQNETNPRLLQGSNTKTVIASKNGNDYETLPKIAFRLYEKNSISIDELSWFIKSLPSMGANLFPSPESIEDRLITEEDVKIDDFFCALHKEKKLTDLEQTVIEYRERIALKKAMCQVETQKPQKRAGII